jgi:demethylmenaquinone methyltransferase/2-methoxy-6-polyprenyl-1,4-benzoquinol methylase
VEYQLADLFEWKPRERFDFVFFGFWISHVPPDRFAGFWELVRSCLSPGARAFFVDNRFPKRAAADTLHIDRDQNTARRSLENGQEFEIVKVYYMPQQLGSELASLGFDSDVHTTENFFLYGDARANESAERT